MMPPAVTCEVPLATADGAVLTCAYQAFTTMQRTRYQHRSPAQVAAGKLGEIDADSGTYLFDCVGFAAWLVRAAAPAAARTLYRETGVSPHNLPGPARWRAFLDDIPDTGNTVGWRPVEEVIPGTVICWPLADDSTGRKGHWVLVVSDPVPREPGVELIAVMDAAIAPHGPLDTRRTDSRCQPADDGRPSGLGIGTMALLRSGSSVAGIRWAPHSRDVHTPVSMGIPLS